MGAPCPPLLVAPGGCGGTCGGHEGSEAGAAGRGETLCWGSRERREQDGQGWSWRPPAAPSLARGQRGPGGVCVCVQKATADGECPRSAGSLGDRKAVQGTRQRVQGRVQCQPAPLPTARRGGWITVGDGSPWSSGLRCRCLDWPLSGAPGAAGGMKTGGWGSPTPRRGGLSPGRTARTGRAQGSGRGSTGHCPPGRAPPMAPPIAIAPPTEPLISQPIAPPRPSPRQSLRPSLHQSLRPAHRSANRPAPVAPPPRPAVASEAWPRPPDAPG